MNKFVVSSVVLSLLMSAAPALAVESGADADASVSTGATEPLSGVAVPKFINVTAEAKAKCQAKCTAQTAQPQTACVEKCVAALQADVKAPRDSATGQASGKRVKAGECEAECRQNNQGNPDALNACLRGCTVVGPAGARVLPTVNKKTIDAKRAEVKTNMEERREAMKEKLDAFKDRRRAALAEKISDSLNKLNERLTNHFLNLLEKLEAVMVRVAAGDVDGDGAADIATANTAIVEAKAAVEAQAGEDYTIAVSTESNVKVDVGAARQDLHSDLKAVEEKVKAAREAVRVAAKSVDKATPKLAE